MSTDVRTAAKAPGLLWIVIPAAAGFCAGFFGPMILVPESNLGPIVGIFFSGPAGLVLGVAGFIAGKFFPGSGRGQWVALTGLSTLLALVTLFYVLPEPERLGLELEVTIKGRRRSAEGADETVEHWKKRIAGVTWTTARAGWEADMRAALGQDRGGLIDVVVHREREIRMNRKPWNHGRTFATGWKDVIAARTLYVPVDGSFAGASGSTRIFIENDSRRGVTAPGDWPPRAFAEFIPWSLATSRPEFMALQ